MGHSAVNSRVLCVFVGQFTRSHWTPADIRTPVSALKVSWLVMGCETL